MLIERFVEITMSTSIDTGLTIEGANWSVLESELSVPLESSGFKELRLLSWLIPYVFMKLNMISLDVSSSLGYPSSSTSFSHGSRLSASDACDPALCDL